jgi:hypothetical protein
VAEEKNEAVEDGREDQDAPAEGEEQQQEQQDDQEQGENPYAPLAAKMGWVPKDQFKGSPDDWKPAEDYILEGRNIQKGLATELKSVRAQLDTVAKTSASIVEQQVNDRLADLQRAHAAAVEDGDTDNALKIAENIGTLRAQANGNAQSGVQPGPDAIAFAERNASWFKKEPLATARAVEITNKLHAMGYDSATQCAEAEKAIKREFPHLFGHNGAKAPAGVHQPGSRGAGPSNRQKGFADMPKPAQDIAKDMVSRGVIPNADVYVKNYFANQKG